MCFSINCPIVICSPTVCYVFEREASSENYGPRVYFYHIIKTKIPLLQFIYFYFTLQFIHLPIQDLILASNEFKGIDNPLVRIGCKYLLLCVQVLFMRLCMILLLDWYLSSHWGKYLSLLCCISPPHRGKFQRSLQVTDSKMHIPMQLTSSRQ